MPETIALSESAVAILRFRIRGYRMPFRERDLATYRELAEAGIMEPGPGGEFRFTPWGMEHRDEILGREEERIERERYEPPDVTILSAPSRSLLRRLAGEERVEVTAENRPAFRELAAARIVILCHSFARGDESIYRFTYWGWHRRHELAEAACAGTHA